MRHYVYSSVYSSEAQLDRMRESFTLRRCKPHAELLKIVQRYMARPATRQQSSPQMTQEPA